MNQQDIEDIYELSPAQQGMFFQSLMGQSAGMLCEQFLCALEGKLDVALLQKACAHVLGRHTSLRTSFHLMEMDKPLQVVHRSVPLPWRELDWRHLPAAEAERQLAALVKEDRERGFELDAAPLLRFTVVRVSEERHHFLWSHHHLLLDGWSLPIVMKELMVSYEALSRGGTPRLQASWPYGEYIAYLQNLRPEDSASFWKTQLDGLPDAPVLGRGQAQAQSKDEVAELTSQVPSALAARLSTLAREQRATSSSLFQCAWALLLGVHTRREDVVFGTTVSGRPPTPLEAASSVGLFINTLPLRVRLRPEETLLELLGRVQAQRVEMQDHEHTPLVRIHEWSGLPQGKSLFDTVLVFENYPQDISVAPLSVRDVKVLGGETPYELTVIVDPDNGYSLRLLHRPATLASALVEEMSKSLLHVLTAFGESPRRTVAEVLAGLRASTTPLTPQAAAPSAPARPPLTADDLPRTPVQKALWEIWSDLLGTHEVGIHDDFFRLGGHSLLATQIISRVRKAFNADISLKALFTSGQTIAQLAETIEEHLIQTGKEEELTDLYAELENMSDEEAERLLREEEGGA